MNYKSISKIFFLQKLYWAVKNVDFSFYLKVCLENVMKCFDYIFVNHIFNGQLQMTVYI